MAPRWQPTPPLIAGISQLSIGRGTGGLLLGCKSDPSVHPPATGLLAKPKPAATALPAPPPLLESPPPPPPLAAAPAPAANGAAAKPASAAAAAVPAPAAADVASPEEVSKAIIGTDAFIPDVYSLHGINHFDTGLMPLSINHETGPARGLDISVVVADNLYSATPWTPECPLVVDG